MTALRPSTSRAFEVPVLARVEGEGALHLSIEGDQVTDARLRIYEPPRFFEGLLKGRSFTEPPDLTARICGICPVAYQMSSAHALEAACGVTVDDPGIVALRRLLYCGEWIESHVLHVAMLHAPDFTGYPSGLAMAADHRELVETALKAKQLGNELVAAVGGRAVHPVNVRVGGFHRTPERSSLEAFLPTLEWAVGALEELARWVASFEFPDYDTDAVGLSVIGDDEYPMNRGSVGTTRGEVVPASAWEELSEEVQVPHSTALHAHLADGAEYQVGPVARWNLNQHVLPERYRALGAELGIAPPVTNPFRSIVVRAVETLYAAEEAVRIIESYPTPERAHVDVVPRAGTGAWATEAPRGTLWHRYTIDDEGLITGARIVPPTAQTQPVMEDDLRRFAQANLHLDDAELQHRCEQVVRNYDPCISCAAHFLSLEITRDGTVTRLD